MGEEKGQRDWMRCCPCCELFTCYFCGKPGHLKRNCDLFKEQQNNKEIESAKVARFNKWYSKSVLRKSETDWCVDSGASSHMCGDVNMFSRFEKISPREIEIADGEKLVSTGKGEVLLMLRLPDHTHMKVVLDNVLFVPGLSGNLISVRKLTQKGFCVNFEGEKCFLKKLGENLEIARYEHSLYRIYTLSSNKCGKDADLGMSAKESSKCVHEWHNVLSHRNIDDILRLKNDGLAIKQCTCDEICVPCIKGKLSKMSFPKKSTPVQSILDCVVSDVCGPLNVESYDHFRYFITFTDVCSRYSEVYFLKTKAEADIKVKYFVEKMKTFFGKKPKILRSDRGGEYMSNRLQEYLANEGIQFQSTVGYAPQQNGIAERKNRTLMEAARTVLADSGVPKCFWTEAVKFANHTLNLIGSTVSPLESFYGHKPDYSVLHRFGCDVCAMIPYEKRKKLDDKAKKYTFVGYDCESKGYRIADVSHKSLTVSRELVFLNSFGDHRASQQYYNLVEILSPPNNSSDSIPESLIDLEESRECDSSSEGEQSFGTADEDNQLTANES